MGIADFRMPSMLRNEKGDFRKVGFELEFGKLDLDSAANCVISVFGGQQIVFNKYVRKVTGTSIGDFNLKVDTRILTEKTYGAFLERLGLDKDNELVEKIVEGLVCMIVPFEIDTPPLPIPDIYRIDDLRKALFLHDASGTTSSLLHAYATHINPEIPELSAEMTLRYIRAFLLLYSWLYHKSHIALSRRLAPFIRPFPDEYINLVLNPAYRPDLGELITDYHLHNPDRNRPLDMYPVFAYMLPEKVNTLEDLGSVKPRPTLHYRLPNSLMDEKDWTLATEWNNWVAVETLAAQPEQIKLLSQEYSDMERDTWLGMYAKWVRRMEDWIACSEGPK